MQRTANANGILYSTAMSRECNKSFPIEANSEVLLSHRADLLMTVHYKKSTKCDPSY